MKFTDVTRARKGNLWTAALSDLQGRTDYEMTIRGPAALVSQAFAKSEFEFLIDSGNRQPTYFAAVPGAKNSTYVVSGEVR